MTTVHNDLPKQIREAQEEAMKRKNVKAENLGRLIKLIFEFRPDGTRCFGNHVWLPRYGGLRVLGLCMSPHKSKYSIHPDQIRCNKDLKICWVFVAANEKRILATYEDMLRACVIDIGNSWDRHLPLVEFSYNNSYHASSKAAPYEALYGRKCRSPICWSEVEDSQLTGPELIRDTTEKIVQIKNHLLTAHSRQKSYTDRRLKPLGRSRMGPIAYTLDLPKELKGIHSTFHVSNLKKCLAKGDVVVPIEEIQLDDKLHMIEELVEIIDKEVKQLKESRIPIVKVRWNSQRGPEFTWEREDHIKKKYPYLFTSKDKAERVDETS
ncbi:putative reverse transcriptase domain-containing protein [Tanacetum coccineum]